MAIGDRPALMPGIVGGLLAKAGTSIFLPEEQWVSSGFFGALIAGFVAGYLILLLKKLLEKVPKSLEGISNRYCYIHSSEFYWTGVIMSLPRKSTNRSI